MNDGWIDYSTWRRGAEHTVSGLVLVWTELPSPQLGGSREIFVYLPPSLVASGPVTDRRYPVLYFHDGQNVFDEHTSFSGEWHADETLESLAGEGLEAIAVAIPNGGEARMDEYNPWRDARRRMGGRGDAYLGYLVGHVKPLIDRSFPTRPDRDGTGIVGSSMGGLISLYGLIAFPAVFGLAGVMSPSLVWNDHRILGMVEAGLAPPARIHLDAGGREWKGMLPEARRLRRLLLEQGFRDGRDLHYVEERHAVHRESAWARRLPDALRFLLGGTRTG
jgi:predicted alpha/beta superfamily hydrolase